ncbi:hypothetical protein [Nocardia camponoti]|uniref:Uncharacterized protein n=1 Tax=Nocardia camponoti TaxID=1616106 RepID=A0A917Q9A1_9NOCA|nr:hypothetical protein [Nocardia camponoti]GGK37132.1 hypothetical protein GCM10011591_06020 [Nocardia camponoti]
MADNLNVDPTLLTQAATGITSIIGELSAMGIGETGAVGRGFSLLTMSSLEIGKPNAQASFETFTERWSWGVRALVQSGNSIAQILNLSAGRYYIMDEQFQSTFKEMFTHVAGNPHASDADIDKMSWGEVLSNNSVNFVLNHNYSKESFVDAANHVGNNVSTLHQVGQYAIDNPGKFGPGVAWDTGVAAKVAEIQQAQQGGAGK